MDRQKPERRCPRSRIEVEVLKRIKPSRLERLAAKRVADAVSTIIKRVLEREGYEATVTVEGSYAKDTWLAGDLDLDVFILLPADKCIDTIESGELLGILKSVLSRYFPVEDRHAQHPYIRVYVDGVWVEVVPGCAIKEGERPLTAVDRTPLHRRYVTSVLDEEKRDEVRLLKAFMKGIGVYGAEIAVEGFSGYLAELLIAYYGCFRHVLEAATSWRPPVVIDLTGRSDRKELLRKFHNHALIVPDPVDPLRNAAAAVSLKSLASFILAAILYLRKPSLSFFNYRVPRDCNPIEVVRNAEGRHIILVEITPSRHVAPDSMWGMVKRGARNLTALLDRMGFNVAGWSVYVEEDALKGYIAIEVLYNPLPELEKQRGPPAWNVDNALKFVEKHISDPAGPWIDVDGRLYVLRVRKVRWVWDAIKHRVSEWLPGSLRGASLRVTTLRDIVEGVSTELCEWLRTFVVRRPRWLTALTA